MSNLVEIIVTAKDMTKTGFDGAKKNAAGLGSVLASVGIAAGVILVGIGVKATEMASTFDAAMTRLNTQAGVSKDQLGVLSAGVLKLSGQVGFDPNSLAASLFHVESNFASLGITAPKALALVKIAAEGAKVGGADLVDVTNALTAAVASGIPGATDFNKAMGALNATVGAGDMTMGDLAKAFSTGFLATVKGYGLTLTDVGAALAVFGDNNIRGAKAGTALRMSVQALASPTLAGAKLLDGFGLSSGQLAKDMASGGILKALEDLKKHLQDGGVTAQDQGKILTDIFGKKAGIGVQILYDQLSRLQSKYPDITRAANGFQNAWTTTTGTLKQQWDNLKSGFDALLVKLGEFITPYIITGIKDIGKAFNFIKDVVGKVSSNKFLDLGGSMKDIKKDALDIVETFKKDWPQIKPVVEAVILGIGALIKVILTLIDWLLKLDNFMIGVWSEFIKMVALSERAVVNFARTFIDSIAIAFGWVPGIGPKLQAAAKLVDKFANSVNASVESIINPTITVHTTFDKERARETGAEIARAIGRISVPVVTRGVDPGAGAPAGHHATGGISSGLTWVGEYGAELIRTAPGTMTYSHGQSLAMATGPIGQSSSGLDTTNVAFHFTGNTDSAFAAMFQKMVRNGGIQMKVNGVLVKV